jgi:phospholipase C
MPAISLPTIGERLSEKKISWAWYAGNWNKAVHGNLEGFIPHHQPFLYFKAFDESSQARTIHLLDEDDFIKAIDEGTLPSVAFYKPAAKHDSHPGYSNMKESEDHVFAIIDKLEHSKQWAKMLVIVTYDDSGGFHDHVSPPKRDRFGPGIRIPTLILSPFAKKGEVDHTVYDSTSILKLIEKRFGLAPLNSSYKNAGDLRHTLQ